MLVFALNADAKKPTRDTIKAVPEKKHVIKSANQSGNLEAELKQLEFSPDSMSFLQALWRGLMPSPDSSEERPLQVPPSPASPMNRNDPRIPNAGVSFPLSRQQEEDEGDGTPNKGKPSKKKKRTNPFAEPPKLKNQRSGKLFQWSAPNLFVKNSGHGPTTRKHIPKGQGNLKKC